MFRTSYHDKSFLSTERQKAIKFVSKTIRKHFKSDSVGLALTGISGMLIGIPAADACDKQFCIIRKDADLKGESHAAFLVEGHILEKYVIIDDWINTGKTIKRIMKEVENVLPYSECVGIILYDSLDNKCKGIKVPIFIQ